MRSKAIFFMGTLNVLLLASLCFRLVPPAQGQIAKPTSKASEYLIISGDAQGLPGGAVYIFDTRNKLLTLRTYANGKLQDLPDPLPLERVFK